MKASYIDHRGCQGQLGVDDMRKQVAFDTALLQFRKNSPRLPPENGSQAAWETFLAHEKILMREKP
jgi:hypothetical protein